MSLHPRPDGPICDDATPTETAAERAAAKALFGLLLDAIEDPDGSATAEAESAKRAASPSVRAAAESLLAAHRRANDLLYESRSGDGASTADRGEMTAPRRWPTIGGHTIEAELGRGGFGIVYRAMQHEPVERPVAIKVLRVDLASDEMARRFRAEAGLLARMSHPGIAHVFDAGVDADGRPYVSMELVAGEPITIACERRGLSVRERVALVAEVSDAVHHAHQRAVIHRDLKPANVLVEEHDGRLRPRVIDFGIAKLTESGTDTAVTHDGSRFGTPRYMSPEQFQPGATADTRVDVYALGVLLCEVLTGRIPHERSDSTPASGTRPCTRPSALAAESPTDAVAARSRTIRGDLDRIILKAVDDDPSERYESAAALADDLRRHLDGLPVRATRPNALYLTSKFIARRRTLSAAIVFGVVALVAGTLLALHGTREAVRSREAIAVALHATEAERARAEAVAEFLLVDMLDALAPDRSGQASPSVQEFLRNAATDATARLDDDPALLLDVLQRVGIAQRRLGDSSAAATTLDRAATLSAERLGIDDRRTIMLELDSILAAREAGGARRDDPRPAALRDRAIAALSPDDPIALRTRLHGSHIGASVDPRPEMAAIERTWRELGLEGSDGHLETLQYLTIAMRHFGDDRLMATLEDAVAIAVAARGPSHSRTMTLRGELARALVDEGRHDEAALLLREQIEHATPMLGVTSPAHARALQTLSRVELLRGNAIDALPLAQTALEAMTTLHGADSVQATTALQHVGVIEHALGHHEDAAKTLTEVVDRRTRIWGEARPSVLLDRVRLADSLVKIDRAGEVEAILKPVFAHLEPTHEVRLEAVAAMAQAIEKLRGHDAAVAYVEDVLASIGTATALPVEFDRWRRTR